MVSFLTHFRGFSFFKLTLFTLVSKASFVLLARNLLHYIADVSGSLFASRGSDQGGCERAFMLIFPLSLYVENFPVRNRHCFFSAPMLFRQPVDERGTAMDIFLLKLESTFTVG